MKHWQPSSSGGVHISVTGVILQQNILTLIIFTRSQSIRRRSVGKL